MLAQFRGTDPLQFIALATGQDGNRDLVQLGGGEHEIDVGRRLLQGLQQGVEGLGGEHVHLVDDDDLEARRGRHELELVLEVAHLLDAAVGGTVYLVQIERRAGDDLPAGVAFVARCRGRALGAVQRLGHQARQRRLADAADAGKQDGMGDAVAFEAVLQGFDYRLLADDIGKGLRPEFTREYQVGHKAVSRSMGMAWGRKK